MSEFEYVTTLAAFIIAFGVSRVPSGWVQQFVRRRETPVFPLQLAISGLMLLALLQNTWAIFLAQGADWTFLSFLILIFMQLSIVGLLIAWMILGGLFDALGHLLMDVPLNRDLPFGLMYSIRAVAVTVFALMAWSARESHHWVGFIVAFLIQIIWIVGVSYNPVAA